MQTNIFSPDDKGKYISMEEKKNGEGKGGKYFEKEIIFFAEEKEDEKGKGDKENVTIAR